jgi:outer membrane receptor protein involved in Fe transport
MHRLPFLAVSALRAGCFAGCVCAVSLSNAQEKAQEQPVVMSPFEVQERSERAYTATATNTGTLIAKLRDEIPFVTSVLTGAAIVDLNALNPSDFATQFAGVARGPSDQATNDGAQLGSGTSFTVRGFISQPLYNGFQTGPLNVSTDSIERVEVTKGPNSILYGQSSAGGAINFVPKAGLLSGSASTVSLGASSNDGYRGSFDTGGPVSDRPGTAFRLGGGYGEYTRKQDFFWNGQSFLYGSFRTNLTEKLSFEMSAEDSRNKTHPARTAAFVSLGAGPARVTDPGNRLRGDRNFNYHGPWSFREGDAWVSSGYLTAKVSDRLTVRLGGLYVRQTEESNAIDGVYGLATGTTATGFYQNTFLERSVKGFKSDLLYQMDFREFTIDSILGFEAHDSSARGQQYRTNTTVTPITITIPFTRRPVASDYPKPPAKNLYTTNSTNNLNDLEWTNLRVTQFVTSPDKRWTAMWGAARGEGDNLTTDYLANGTAKATGDDITYTVGTTYQFAATARGKWTAFANTSTSFLIQAGNRQNPNDFTRFTTVAALRAYAETVAPNPIDPQLGEGQEAGIRFAAADGKLRVEVLAFRQERSNISRDFFVRESNVPGVPSEQLIKTFQLASGVEESQGVEASFDWNPTRAFSLMGSVLVSDGEVKSNVQAPEEVGFQLVNSPEKMWNFWARYSPVEGPLKRTIFGLGATYRNETRTFPTSPDRYRLSDEYTLVRAMVGYGFGRGKTKHQISVHAENLLDETYVAENGTLSEPAIYRINYTLKW